MANVIFCSYKVFSLDLSLVLSIHLQIVLDGMHQKVGAKIHLDWKSQSSTYWFCGCRLATYCPRALISPSE